MQENRIIITNYQHNSAFVCYPFGMLRPGRQYANAAFADGYRYGFQGQEFDNEWNGDGNSYSYKYRMHDPRIGRFYSIDSLANDYPWNSVYSFSENSVIAFFELEGLESYWAADGTKIGNVGDNDKIRIINTDEISKSEAVLLVHQANISTEKIDENGMCVHDVELVKMKYIAHSRLLSLSTPLYYDVGNKEDKEAWNRTGIEGNSFEKDHPLYEQRMQLTGDFATVYGQPVRESHLNDLTDKFNKVLKDSNSNFERTLTGPWSYWFGFQVTDDGPYDLKSTSRDNTEIPCFAAIVIGEWTLYEGRLTRYDDYGNISYGYWGSLYGFDPITLYKGSDDNQDTKNGVTTDGSGDEKRDKDAIGLGIGKYYETR